MRRGEESLQVVACRQLEHGAKSSRASYCQTGTGYTLREERQPRLLRAIWGQPGLYRTILLRGSPLSLADTARIYASRDYSPSLKLVDVPSFAPGLTLVFRIPVTVSLAPYCTPARPHGINGVPRNTILDSSYGDRNSVFGVEMV